MQDFSMKKDKITVWIITEGLAGTENQCIGVAEALGVDFAVKRIGLRQPWRALSPYLALETSVTFDTPLMPPWPDLLITSGRKAIAASRYIKRKSGGKTCTVHIQDPRIHPRHFDMVAVPAHDRLRGDNVVVTMAAPNRITPDRLEEAKAAFPAFGDLKSPKVAVLIGGNSRAHRLTPDIMQALARQLKALDASLMVTTSRRTGAVNEKVLRETLEGTGAYIWDGQGENPYFALLGWADHIIVTSDSASMLSEAATTGKPVYMVPLVGGGKRIDKLHENLMMVGAVRIFNGELDNWSYQPLNDAKKVATFIRENITLPV